ncbi:MAG: hypothetical protein H7256_03360 [Bdellovibrio sp.]|nr:hypothetical protein [Bdellovibrio sp.]
MKKMWILLSGGLIVISACMIYFILHGISLRTEPIIDPSIISQDHQNIADGLLTRLFPELQNDAFILWGASLDSAEFMTTVTLTKKTYEQRFGKSVTLLMDAENKTAEEIKNCAAPCWILVDTKNANQLVTNNFVEQKLKPLKKEFFTITWLPFKINEVVPAECENQKRIDRLDCIRTLTVRDSLRRLKKKDQLYFFLRRYNEQDYFLFVQQPN